VIKSIRLHRSIPIYDARVLGMQRAVCKDAECIHRQTCINTDNYVFVLCPMVASYELKSDKRVIH